MSVIDDLTRIAKSQIGNNGSKYRKWFYNRTSDYYGVNWCAVFISWLFNQVNGLDKYMIKTDGAGTVARLSDGKYGKWYEPNKITPREGDIVMFRWGGSYTDKYHSDHLGYVYYADSSYIYTVEGNTGSNSADYSTVMYKQYSKTNGVINGYYRPYYNQKEEKEMNFKKGDKSDGVLAYKSLLQQGQKLGIIKSKVDSTNGFGGGTYKATLEVQKKYGLVVDGVAGVRTITALRNAVSKAQNKLIYPSEISSGWGIGVRMAKICLRTLQKKGTIKTKPDGKYGYGAGTKKAIKEVQAAAKLKQDGIIGSATANAIEKLLQEN